MHSPQSHLNRATLQADRTPLRATMRAAAITLCLALVALQFARMALDLATTLPGIIAASVERNAL